MITIQTRNNLLIQIHKSQLRAYMNEVVNVEFTGFGDKVVTLSASVQTLTNCYILTINDGGALESLGLNATMKVLGAFNVVLYQSKIQLFIPAAPEPVLDPPPPLVFENEGEVFFPTDPINPEAIPVTN